MKERINQMLTASIRNIIGIIIVIGCFLLLYLLIASPIPTENKDTVNLAIGFVFGGGLAGVIGYYFGSSKGETDAAKKKDLP